MFSSYVGCWSIGDAKDPYKKNIVIDKDPFGTQCRSWGNSNRTFSNFKLPLATTDSIFSLGLNT